MKRLLTAVLALCCLAGALALTGCGKQFAGVYDDDAAQVRSSDSYFALQSMTNQTDNVIELRHKEFSGVKTVGRFTVDADSLVTVNADITVSQGEFKLVLVNRDEKTLLGTLNFDADATEASLEDLPLPPGRYALRMVGRESQTEGEVTYELEEQ